MEILRQLDWIALFIFVSGVIYGYGHLRKAVTDIEGLICSMKEKIDGHIGRTEIHVDPIRDSEWRDLIRSGLATILESQNRLVTEQAQLLADLRATRSDVNGIRESLSHVQRKFTQSAKES